MRGESHRIYSVDESALIQNRGRLGEGVGRRNIQLFSKKTFCLAELVFSFIFVYASTFACFSWLCDRFKYCLCLVLFLVFVGHGACWLPPRGVAGPRPE